MTAQLTSRFQQALHTNYIDVSPGEYVLLGSQEPGKSFTKGVALVHGIHPETNEIFCNSLNITSNLYLSGIAQNLGMPLPSTVSDRPIFLAEI